MVYKRKRTFLTFLVSPFVPYFLRVLVLPAAGHHFLMLPSFFVAGGAVREAQRSATKLAGAPRPAWRVPLRYPFWFIALTYARIFFPVAIEYTSSSNGLAPIS